MSGEPLPPLTKDDLEELLHSKVDSFTISPLTAPGENYGSTMLLVDITLPDHKKKSIVAKMVSEFPHMREFFRFRETVRKEIYTYRLVRPEFLAIQKEHKIPEDLFLDVIPECYGARTSRGGGIDQPVDESSVILMENLKESGYRLADRIVGLDLKHLEYVVTRLARFHATATVLKLKKPEVFRDTVMKAAAEFNRAPPPDGGEDKGPEGILDTLSDLPVVQRFMARLKEVMAKEYAQFKKGEFPKPREPFATLLHNDFWTNNMMFSYGGSIGEEITGVKIFDFQLAAYGSPVRDLLFLLYSSRSLNVTKEDCDDLIRLYHNEFIKWLELFGCDTELFNYDKFMKEVETEAPVCFPRAFIMLRISSVPSSNAPDLSKVSEKHKIFRSNSGLGEVYFQKVEKLVLECVERNWI
ncbi:uncharacterized protein LOC134538964 isoform X2 [Bacillus rossius redtenbacheri]